METQAIPTEKPKHAGGRPTSYSPIIVGKLIGAFQLGLSVSSACDIAYIEPSTFYDWMKKYPEFSEKITAARTYGKVLAAQQIQDVLQDTQRGKVDHNTGKLIPNKYSEQTRVNTAKWFIERQDREAFGSTGGILGAKVEADGKGGTTATILYANDDILRQFTRQEETDSGQLLEALEDSLPGEEITGGGTEESTPPVHPEELQGEHTSQEGVPQP